MTKKIDQNQANWFFRIVLTILMFSSLAIGQEKANEKELDISSDLQIIKQKITEEKPLTWLFVGDSITQGLFHTRGGRSYTEHFAERVRGELRRVRDIVINTAINGERTKELLNDFEWRVGRFKPDVVSIMYGTNDSKSGEAGRQKFKDNLIKIIRQVRDINAIPLLNTPNPIYEEKGKAGRKDLPAYIEIIREIANKEKVILVDHYKYWQDTKPSKALLINWLNDDLHPNKRGHLAMAVKIFEILGIYGPGSKICRSFIP